MKNVRLQLSDLPKNLDFPIDLFLCSASFEARCRSIPDALHKKDIKMTVIAENQNHLALHGQNAEYLLRQFPKAEKAMLDTSNPIKTADALLHGLRNMPTAPPKSVVVDVTTFTHEAVLILFRLLKARDMLPRTLFLYCCAKSYSGDDPPEKKWLSRGVGQVRSVLGYPGKMRPSRKLHLIVLTGFEVERVSELIRRYEPSVISLGYADSPEPHAALHQPSNSASLAQLRAIHGPAMEFSFDCYDPGKTKLAILDRAKATPEHNIVVAPLSTKLSTIGAALAASESEDIQICYAQALIYNHQNYSVPGDACYIFQPEG